MLTLKYKNIILTIQKTGTEKKKEYMTKWQDCGGFQPYSKNF